MKDLYIDFETYYDRQYSLTKLTTAEYVLSPSFECYMLAMQEGAHGAPFVVDGVENVRRAVAAIPWHEYRVICHNIHFDSAVLAWHFRAPPPAQWGCSLALARMVHPEWRRHSLAACSTELGLEAKGDVLHKMSGVRWANAPDWLQAEMRVYALRDVANGWEIWRQCILALLLEGEELPHLDRTVRMWTEPTLLLDPAALIGHKARIEHDIQTKVDRVQRDFGIDATVLRSDDKLAACCRLMHIDVPMKPRPTKPDELKPAFAKSDEEFMDWETDPDPVKQAIHAARIGVKSTIEYSRCQRLLDICTATRGVLPVPLVFGNTNTWRLSGGEKLNLQNLPVRGGSIELRRAIHAPAGHVIVAVDASQIECRLNAWWSGETQLLEAFREGRDPYCEFASGMFRRTITKADKQERQVGKVAVLSCGYQAWIMAFERMLYTNGVVPPAGHSLSSLAMQAVMHYRRTMSRICVNWKIVEQQALPVMLDGGATRIGGVMFSRAMICLPSGHVISYPDLRRDVIEGEVVFTYLRRGVRKKVYSGLIVENVVQAMARDHIMETWGVLDEEFGIRCCLQEHDALATVVPVEEADNIVRVMRNLVGRSPRWAPDCPMKAEAGYAVRYGDIVKS
jgi:DNA polymerase family A